ncbi:FAD-dependent oxidoreductase [Sulfidibacter corallicola]|uniref:Tryptophan 2-monooxygenase n=1 Tax=Sulfidibacter corallicola TaxID=2818388 RepID=A0A8A4TL02_SULCO|nr:FAD-dependent oxidoreductase [Sulfidibacter corallicola]QTD50636.1 FAD-dependent oxidoreductase [Sulfidibacter corallicola]
MTGKGMTGWTRRQFLTRVGQAGGAAALYETMVAMGLIHKPAAWDGPPKMERGSGVGKSVVILGAGIGGLTAAYLLSQYGYRCHILEADHRAGGRNHTARRGSTIVERSKEHGTTYQHCRFDSGLYMNLGPGRLPYHHRRVLGYCQELDVVLQPYVMNTTGNLFQTSRGALNRPFPYRRMQHDTRGYIAELLAKAVNKGALDREMSGEDREKLLGLLRTFGPLGKKHNTCEDQSDYHYEGSTRVGCGPDPQGTPTPNVFYNCDIPAKMPFRALLDSNFWNTSFYDPFEFEWQPTLFQPVGGMDMIVEGFLRKVGHLITYNAPVTDIDVSDEGVTVAYRIGQREDTLRADYCVSNIPCPVLKDIDNNFREDFAKAVARTTFDASCKVGWQCNTRFWEGHDYQIYGGISWTDDIIEQIWYPSNDYFSKKGTLTGAYIHDGICPDAPRNATEFGKWDLAKRLRVAKEGGARLHREFEDNSIVPTELGLSIAWQNVPYLAGAWPSWGEGQHDDADYRRLLLPDRRFYVVGDQASTLPGWQEGSMMSAEHVVELIGGLKPAIVPEDCTAPNTFKITRGHG